MISGAEFVARFPVLARALAALGEHAAREEAAEGSEPSTGTPWPAEVTGATVDDPA